MPLVRDLSHLPTPAATKGDAVAPDPEPTFLAPYFEALAERHDADGERPHAVEGTRFRHSMADGCSRAIAYHALQLPESDPMDVTGILVTGNGTAKHDEVQAILTERLGKSAPQVEVPCRVEGFDGSGTADGFTFDDEHRTCWEHKNVGGYAFKMAVGERGAPQGPKRAHIVQGALNALALDCDLLVITYLTWEAISVNAAARKRISEVGRVAAQWTFERAQWEPLARAEVARVTAILALLDAGTLPARKFPDPEFPKGAVITDPSTGQWQVRGEEGDTLDAGSWWACAYCRWQGVCAKSPAGRAPVEVLVELGALPAKAVA